MGASLMIRSREIPLGSSGELPLESIITINSAGEFSVGGGGTDENSEVEVLLNWKMLLGQSAAEIQAHSLNDPFFGSILTKKAFLELAKEFFRHVVQKTVVNTKSADVPQFIVGIPAIPEKEGNWRTNYQRNIKEIFSALGYPEPRFFPEPFAVFQHHWNKGNIKEQGEHQNVLVIDIGGGTTNVCLIQTTQKARLARSGRAKLPQGVKTIDVGGSTIDRLILERLASAGMIKHAPFALLSAAAAKIDLSLRATKENVWSDPVQAAKLTTTIKLSHKDARSFTARDLGEIIQARFWPRSGQLSLNPLCKLRMQNYPILLRRFIM